MFVQLKSAQDVDLIKGIISKLSLNFCILNKFHSRGQQHSAVLTEFKENKELSEGYRRTVTLAV